MLLAEGQIVENTLRFESNTVAAPYGVGPQGIANRDDSASIKFVGTVITFTGTMAISGAISLPNGSAAAPSLNFTNSATTGLYRSAANTIGISVAGALDFSVSANSLNVLTGSNVALADSAQTRFGDAADIAMTWDGTKFAITQAAPNSTIDMGVDGAGIDVIFRGDTASASLTWDQSADALVRAGAVVDLYTQAGGSTGVVVEVIGPDLTHGMKTVCVSGTVVPAAIETTLFTMPAISRLVAVQANCDAALTGGGTTVTWGIGVTGDVDTFGTVFAAGSQADALTKNSKVNAIGTPASPPQPGSGVGQFFASATAVKLIGAATGGTSAGDTALTVGSVSFRIIYQTLMPLADAP